MPAGFAVGVPNVGIAPVVAGAPGNVAFFHHGHGLGRGGSDWFGTARVRVGWAFDRMLVYATGGLAFTEDNTKNHFGFGGLTSGAQITGPFYVGPNSASFGATVSNSGGHFGRRGSDDFGWALGGGVEWAFMGTAASANTSRRRPIEGRREMLCCKRARNSAAQLRSTGPPSVTLPQKKAAH